MSIQYPGEEELLLAKETNHWSDEDLKRFECFLDSYKSSIPDSISVQDLSLSVAIHEDAHQAFWFEHEDQDFGDLASMLVTYDLSDIKEGQTTLAQYLIEKHQHYHKVENGYVFFAGMRSD